MDISKITGQIARIKVTSVVDKLFIFGLLFISLAMVGGFFKLETYIIITVLGLGIVMTIVGIISYAYFADKNPTYLRSEEFHLRQQSIEMLGDKENYLPIDGKDIVSITNPYKAQIGKDNNEV